MKHWRYIFGILAFAAVAAWVAPQPRPPAVSVAVRGFETNTYGGWQDCVLVLTNRSREQFTVWMQAQTNSPSGWIPVEQGFHGNRDASYRPDLPAFSQRTLRFQLSPPMCRWRVVLRCYQENPANLKGVAWLRRRVYSLMFGLYPEHYFTSPEMQPNQAASGNGAAALPLYVETFWRAVPQQIR